MILQLAVYNSFVGFVALLLCRRIATVHAQTLNAGGATFPSPLYTKYAEEVKKNYSQISINYEAVGSTVGIAQITAGVRDFAASDAAMTDYQITKVANGIILVPIAGGAVSIVYNIPGLPNVKLSRPTLAAIFTGQITIWNDPRIKSDNPGVIIPNLGIKPVVRTDGSGTTYILTNHLSSISAYFKGRIGTSVAPNWTFPYVLRGSGNTGAASVVQRTVGSIGYVEYSFAVENKLQSALIQNKQGTFVSPSLQTINKTLSTATFPDNFRVFIPDPSDGYPIVGFTWMLINRKYFDRNKSKAVRQWVNWVLTQGQVFNNGLSYTAIPASVVNRVLQLVNSLLA